MADETSGSVLDALKAGAVIVEEGGGNVTPVGAVAERSTGDGTGDDARSANPGAAPVIGDDPFAAEFDGRSASVGNATPPGAARPAPAIEPEPARDGRASPEAGAKRAYTRRKNADLQKTVSGVETILLSLHAGLSTVLRDPDWDISEEEANKLAEALADVQAQYGLQLDPKTQAWLHLIGVVGGVYGSRIGAKMMLARMAKEQRRLDAASARENNEEAPTPEPPRAAPNVNGSGARPGFGRVGEITHPSQMYPRGHGGAHN